MTDSVSLNVVMADELCLSKQEKKLVNNLEDFYKNSIYFDLLVEIINGDSSISRRTFEYFVTKYSNINKIKLKINKNEFNVYHSYKIQLKKFHKKYFDPFGRGLRIPFFLNDNCILTTIGQLNFYRWFFDNKLYDYCVENYENIQLELINTKNMPKKKKKTSYKKIVKKPFNYEQPDLDNLYVSFDI